MIKKLFSGFTVQKETQRQADLYRKLIRHEARIGGELFGPVPKGGRREFFCLDEHTWVWHEEWLDDHGQRHVTTTRYDVRPNGIIKSQNGTYRPLTPEEAYNLMDAAYMYRDRIKKEIYSFVA